VKRNLVLHWANEIRFFSFSSVKLHKNYQMSGKINPHICLLFSAYEGFIKQQGRRILQDLTALEI